MDPGRLCLPKSEEICNSMYLFHCFGGSECLRCLCFQKNTSITSVSSDSAALIRLKSIDIEPLKMDFQHQI